MDVSSSRKWASRGRKHETNPPSYLRSGLLVLKRSRISLRWDQRQQIKAWLKFFMPTFQVQHREHLFHVSQQCLQERNRKRGKILPTAGNMFLLVVHSQKQGRQMPLVKKSYLFCPWKRLKNNKRGFNKEEHDLKLLLPVFLPRRGRYPPPPQRGGTTRTCCTWKATQYTPRELFTPKAAEGTQPKQGTLLR